MIAYVTQIDPFSGRLIIEKREKGKSKSEVISLISEFLRVCQIEDIFLSYFNQLNENANKNLTAKLSSLGLLLKVTFKFSLT